MNVSAKVEYAMRALLEMAARGVPTSGERLAESQGISTKFLLAILNDLRRAGLVASQRGPDGGYRLVVPADEITPADVIRAVEGPIAAVRNVAPEATRYHGAAQHLNAVWVAARASLQQVLEEVTLAQILTGSFGPHVAGILSEPEAWQPEQLPYPRIQKSGASLP